VNLPFVNKIVIIIDQGDNSIEYIFSRSKIKLNNGGFKINKEEGKERFRIYNCKFSGSNLKIGIIVNGLDEIKTNKHTIQKMLGRE